jgi:hypothetical protein
LGEVEAIHWDNNDIKAEFIREPIRDVRFPGSRLTNDAQNPPLARDHETAGALDEFCEVCHSS